MVWDALVLQGGGYPQSRAALESEHPELESQVPDQLGLGVAHPANPRRELDPAAAEQAGLSAGIEQHLAIPAPRLALGFQERFVLVYPAVESRTQET